MAATNDGNAGKETAPGSLFETAKGLKSDIKRLDERIPQLEQLHKRALTAVGETASSITREIDSATRDMNTLAGSIHSRLSGLTGRSKTHNKGEEKMAAMQQRKLAKSFLAVTRRFEELQSSYRNLYRKQLERQYLIVNPSAAASDVEAALHAMDSAGSIEQHQQVPIAHTHKTCHV